MKLPFGLIVTQRAWLREALTWADELQRYHQQLTNTLQAIADREGIVPPLPTQLAHANSLIECLLAALGEPTDY